MNELAEKTEEKPDETIVDDNINDDELEDETPELEEWQKPVESEEEEEEYKVDGKLHQDMKFKLKGRLSKRDDKIEELEAKITDLEKKKSEPETKILKRPVRDDALTDEEHQEALTKYDNDLSQQTYERNQLKSKKDTNIQQAIAKRDKEVDSHYDRAGELIKNSNITEELYQKADTVLRKAVEEHAPKMGDIIMDNIISILGKGSEKVMYKLGVNKPARNKFLELLKADPSGMKAAVYLGQQKQKITNPKKPQSKAPDPAADIHGDEKITVKSVGKLKKAYDKAEEGQAKYDAKKAAKAAGVDTSKWD